VSPDIALHLSRQAEEWSDLDLIPLGHCEACADETDTPPVCRACAEEFEADEEAARAYREGRY
jgi:hypothetical protein